MVQSYRHAVGRSMKTVRLFFASDQRSKAISWFALLLGLPLAVSALNIVNSYVGRDFMTAISNRHPRQFLTFGVLYACVFVGSSIVAAFIDSRKNGFAFCGAPG